MEDVVGIPHALEGGETGELGVALDPARLLSTTLHHAYGIVQKEYVTVPADLLDDTAQLLPWFGASYAYAVTLKAKPKKRRA